jgi:hypothetical protein
VNYYSGTAQAVQVSWVSRRWLAPELKQPGLLTDFETKMAGLEFNYQGKHD